MSKFIFAFKIAALIIAVCALQACSAIRLVYNQAPEAAFWWLDGYLDFNSLQSPKVREELAKLHQWHRGQELPKAAQLLTQTAQLMPGEVSAAQACQKFTQARALASNFAEQALTPSLQIALTLTPEQLQVLKKKYEKTNETYRKEHLQGSESERSAKRLKQAIERSEMLYGSLSDEQTALIKRLVQSSSYDAALISKERQRRQAELLSMLAAWQSSKPSPEQASAALRRYVSASINPSQDSPDPAYRALSAKLQQEGCTSFAAVHASTSPEQRAKAVAVLKGYEADLRELSAAR